MRLERLRLFGKRTERIGKVQGGIGKKPIELGRKVLLRYVDVAPDMGSCVYKVAHGDNDTTANE